MITTGSRFLVIAASILLVARSEDSPGISNTDCGRFVSHKMLLGNRTETSDFTWLVLLQYDTPLGLSAACGGVLLTNRHVLTAGHCVGNVPANWTLVSVRLGEYDTTTNPDCFSEGDADNTTTCLPEAVSVPVIKSTTHENYDPLYRGHDLAVLQLNESVNAMPICLPDRLAEPQRFSVAGWGRLAGRLGSGPKMHSYVTIFNETLCRDSFTEYKVYLSTDQLCAGGEAHQFPCFADSGGPLMGIKKMADGRHRMAVFGLLTTDSRFCDVQGWPAIYTNITHYVDWIQGQIM